MKIEFQSTDAFSIDEIVAAMNRCFEGYIIPVHVDRPSLAQMLGVDTIDLTASLIGRAGGDTVALALVARRGWTCRLAAMAVAPNLRRLGVGHSLVNLLLTQACGRGDREFVLECIEQNPAGLRLYENAGFAKVRRLVGYVADAIEPASNQSIKEIDLAEVGSFVAIHCLQNLPWQISAQTIAAMSPPNKAFQLVDSIIAITDPNAETLTIRAIVTKPESRRRGSATRLIRALSALFPGRKWRIPAVCPEEIPEAFFAKLGFRRGEISQWQMRSDLTD
jgi:ribosomal protein S18 acetylase RimI-like enzyme